MKGFMYFNWTLFLVYKGIQIFIGFQYRNKCDYA